MCTVISCEFMESYLEKYGQIWCCVNIVRTVKVMIHWFITPIKWIKMNQGYKNADNTGVVHSW